MPGLHLIFRMKIQSLFLLLMFSSALWAQTPNQYLAAGDKEFKDGYPQSAIFYYKKALAMDTNIAEGHFKTAESYRLLRNYKRAESYYLSTTDLDGKDNYLEAHFWLAMMQKQQGKYELATKRFNYFLSAYRQRDDLYRWAREEIESCQWAIVHKEDEPAFEVSRPDSGLNSIHAELSPMMLDSATLYFSTMRYESDLVRKSKPVFIEVKKAVKDSNEWTLVDLDIPAAGANFHHANPSFSSDSSRVYFSRCTSMSDCKIFMAKRQGEGWSEAAALPEPVNIAGSSTTQPVIVTLDKNEYLFFSSNRDRGKGGMDIWFVQVKNGEAMRKTRNLGSRVNSKGDEITPWYDAHDSTFYFSSNRLSGFGGFDIFMSKGAPGSFSLVENAGTDINSPADDYYLTIHKEDSLGYFASNRKTGLKKAGNETCCNDLYKLRVLPELIEIDSVPEEDSLEIVEVLPLDSANSKGSNQEKKPEPKTIEELQQYLPITLYFHNDRPNPRTLDTTTNQSYATTLIDYAARIGEYLEEIDKSDLSDYDKQLAKQQTQAFFNESVGSSEEQLERATEVLLSELENGAEIELAVKGYASPLAKSDYNLNLTLRRIESMVNYFRQFKDGALLPYLDGSAENGGSLRVQKIPFGESQASDAATKAASRYETIYSLTSAQERRIEILKIQRTPSAP